MRAKVLNRLHAGPRNSLCIDALKPGGLDKLDLAGDIQDFIQTPVAISLVRNDTLIRVLQESLARESTFRSIALPRKTTIGGSPTARSALTMHRVWHLDTRESMCQH